MNAECQWIDSNLEAYFCDALNSDENRRARNHIADCDRCRGMVAELNAVDPVVRGLFRHELARARSPQRRSPALIGSVATALAALILVIVMQVPRFVTNDNPQVNLPFASATTAPLDEPAIPKVPEPVSTERMKPDAAAIDQRGQVPVRPIPVGENAPDFLVTDTAGYSRNLNDFRNHVLIFGVWTSQRPQTVSSLQRVYQAFSPNTKLRVLGVATQREAKPVTATFPITYNQGSKLFGAKTGELLIVDSSGVVRMRGTLEQDQTALVNSIKTKLTELGVQ
jgi:hypothetical protein